VPAQVPQEVMPAMAEARIEDGAKKEAEWKKAYEEYKGKYPEEAVEFESIESGTLDPNWADAMPKFSGESKPLATRAHSQTMLNAIAPVVPGFVGGSADLAGSNLTLVKAYGDFQKGSYAERNFRFGVREHGMGAIGNGAALLASRALSVCEHGRACAI
jgi:transketolase